jgi:hypothetical protein
MPFKSRIHLVIFIIFGFATELFLIDELGTKAAAAADTFSKQEILLPTSVPEKNQLRPVSILPVTVGGQIVGRIVVYDDPATQRSADYLELYTNTGDLVAVSWFDRYGVEWTAVDRGLLEDKDELEGILVVVLDGEAV